MRPFLARVVALPPTLLGVALLAYALLSLAPGDAALAMLGGEADADSIAALRAAYALDAPWPWRFAVWLGHLLTGDLGRSIQTGRPVREMLATALGPTAELAGAAFALAALVAIPAGALAAARRGGAVDWAARLVALAGLSLPAFWLGLLLIQALSLRLRWLPPSGHASFATEPLEAARHLALPALTLAAALAAATLRMMRTTMLETLPADFVRAARAKGLSPLRVFGLHALRPALAPVAALLGVQLGQALGGVVVTETLFGWPGLGRLMVQAIFARDLPVALGVLLLGAALALAANLAAELLAAWLDPRLRRPA